MGPKTEKLPGLSRTRSEERPGWPTIALEPSIVVIKIMIQNLLVSLAIAPVVEWSPGSLPERATRVRPRERTVHMRFRGYTWVDAQLYPLTLGKLFSSVSLSNKISTV